MITEMSRKRLAECLAVLHQGYEPVAARFGLTNDNCPHRGRADLPLAALEEEVNAGARLFGYFENDTLCGVVSVKKSGDVLKLNDLVVLPSLERQGIGGALLNFVKRMAAEWGCAKVTLGMIDDNRALKAWYERHGFAAVMLKRFDGAPFVVGYMEWDCRGKIEGTPRGSAWTPA